MLAEPRCRQRWTLNPRGKFWTDDDNKFGQKMLEKMGWTRGKGLGRNEDGNPENIEVIYKNDSKGMGYKGNDDNWVSHMEDFNSLLENLQENMVGKVEVKEHKSVQNLESRSKTSKGRLHYHRFVQGKDLSKHAEKDMMCLFGPKRESNKEKEAASGVENEVPAEETTVSNNDTTFTSAFTIQEYFSKKMLAARLKAKERLEVDEKSELLENRRAEDELIDNASFTNKKMHKVNVLEAPTAAVEHSTSFLNNFVKNDTALQENKQDAEENWVKTEKKRKRRKHEQEENQILAESEKVESKRKSKKKRSKEEDFKCAEEICKRISIIDKCDCRDVSDVQVQNLKPSQKKKKKLSCELLSESATNAEASKNVNKFSEINSYSCSEKENNADGVLNCNVTISESLGNLVGNSVCEAPENGCDNPSTATRAEVVDSERALRKEKKKRQRDVESLGVENAIENVPSKETKDLGNDVHSSYKLSNSDNVCFNTNSEGDLVDSNLSSHCRATKKKLRKNKKIESENGSLESKDGDEKTAQLDIMIADDGKVEEKSQVNMEDSTQVIDKKQEEHKTDGREVSMSPSQYSVKHKFSKKYKGPKPAFTNSELIKVVLENTILSTTNILSIKGYGNK